MSESINSSNNSSSKKDDANSNAPPADGKTENPPAENPLETGQFIDLTNDLSTKSMDYQKLCRNIWRYLVNYTPNSPRPTWNSTILLKLLQDVREKMDGEVLIPEISTTQKPTIVFGPIFGEGDSLVTLMSQAGMPPDVNYVMLGCYTGKGFAPLECICLLLSMKMLYPTNMYLLKGHHEESLSLEMLKLGNWLQLRGIALNTPEHQQIIDEMKKSCSAFSPAAFLDSRILCMAGGPGPLLRKKNGLKKLMKMQRKLKYSVKEKNLLMESSWSVMILNEAQKEMHGMPYFTPEQASEFCQSNNLHCLIRGRQLVDQGFLNKPKDVITIISAVAYLDNFRNFAAVLKIQGPKGTIIRYKMEEGEQLSLELVKPGIGRNVVA
ncbi:unnamed protein product [Caenorhabditis angaria]|uniref:Serine/threonine specific protein phosphatases domain-containing protein n=1 Tax=Caenorhabditis angaria TaxID=860376 RepID=A0A9P1IH18_9PELO|nr:unnamed protein product [Caenorhabditis angaria]